MTDLVKPVLRLCHKQRFIDAVDCKGNTALHIATEKGFIEIMKLLIKNKANPKVRNHVSYCGYHNLYTNSLKWRIFITMLNTSMPQ